MIDLSDSHMRSLAAPSPPRLFSDAGISRMDGLFPARAAAAVTAGAGERIMDGAITAVEIIGVGVAVSYFNAKNAQAGKVAYELAGLPVDVVVGILVAGSAVFTNFWGRMSGHALNVGIGFLLAYGCRMGALWGQAARAEMPQAAGVRGYFGPAQQGAPGPQDLEEAQYPWARAAA
jgi:hypothetical protein